MADNVTTQTASLSSIPNATEIETYDTGDGHRQIVAIGAAGTKTFSDPAPTTSATLVLSANAARLSALIVNAGSVLVYLGPSGVTTTTGFPLAVGAAYEDTTSRDAWYGITASGTADVRVCEVS